jgi:hypothetical protein
MMAEIGERPSKLLDESKPLDPRAQSPEFSMISDNEMKRINIEFSFNPARLIQLLHEDEESFYRMLCLSNGIDCKMKNKNFV